MNRSGMSLTTDNEHVDAVNVFSEEDSDDILGCYNLDDFSREYVGDMSDLEGKVADLRGQVGEIRGNGRKVRGDLDDLEMKVDSMLREARGMRSSARQEKYLEKVLCRLSGDPLNDIPLQKFEDVSVFPTVSRRTTPPPRPPRPGILSRFFRRRSQRKVRPVPEQDVVA
ncbi:uncharacterized protein LOC118432042 [Branchiostoma floridae]|uniref:Uncharacterized protein LOC118432042 n=2 Tax=Branchiostoma floridae TaxID=7739 RepID=A0A9J7MES3_BRAFL|nr:uncharacterized protein LOC118432042 [Branchiostoma floridae]